jgi:hypothetical protein
MHPYDSTNMYLETTCINEQKKNKKLEYCNLYLISHLIISFFAVYLSWRCNNGFNLLSFTAALFCPYLYIIWSLATKGGCGIFDDQTPNITTISPFRPIRY